MRQIITRVPDDLAERLKQLAAIEKRSVNATVVDAVERVLAVPASRRQAWRARNNHALVKRSPVPSDARSPKPEYAAETGPALTSAALDDDRSER